MLARRVVFVTSTPCYAGDDDGDDDDDLMQWLIPWDCGSQDQHENLVVGSSVTPTSTECLTKSTPGAAL